MSLSFRSLGAEGEIYEWRFTEAYMVVDTQSTLPVRLLDGKIISTYDVARDTARSRTGMEGRTMIVQMYGVRPVRVAECDGSRPSSGAGEPPVSR